MAKLVTHCKTRNPLQIWSASWNISMHAVEIAVLLHHNYQQPL